MMIPVNRNPKFNASINPKFNASINPKFNASINPKFNASINPKFNSSINPRFTPRINPSYTPGINPKFNASINPRFNASINPNVTANMQALLVYDLNVSPISFAVELPGKVGYILYNYQLTAEGYCFSDGGKGFVVFNMNMENIGYWSPTEKGFNWFDNSAEWIYFIIK